MKINKSMKNIIDRKEFIKEANSLYSSLKELISDFIEDNNLDVRFVTDQYWKKDYKKDIQNLKNYLSENGVDLNTVFIKFKSNIYNDSFFTDSNGFLDTLLYTYNKDYPLSGNVLADYGGGDEFVIKYQYGYQNYDLGKKYLLQKYDRLEDFYLECSNRLSEKIDYNYGIESKDIILTDNKDKSYICVLNTILLYQKLLSYHRQNVIEAKNSLSDIDKELKELKHKFFEKYNTYIIIFGDLDPNSISENDLKEYLKKLDLKINMNQFNL